MTGQGAAQQSAAFFEGIYYRIVDDPSEQLIGDISADRVDTTAMAVINALRGVIRDQSVSYPEFEAVKRWFVDIGEQREWGLLLDMLFESTVEEVASCAHEATRGSILGPNYLADQSRLPPHATLPMRENEAGQPLMFSGQVCDVDMNPVPDAKVEIWQADNAGAYSGFAPGVPEGNLRGVVTLDDQGRFEIRSIVPAPYQIYDGGPTGKLIKAAKWHPWRPSHLHVMVRCAGYRLITTQLFFKGEKWVDSDVMGVVRSDLLLESRAPEGDSTFRANYNFVLEKR